ncbi:MAG: Gp49 family protein [Photobacterium halotolerans]
MPVTPLHIKELASQLQPKFHQYPDTKTVVCSLFLPNGYEVATGSSLGLAPDRFSEKDGEQWAYRDAMAKAIDQLWRIKTYEAMDS